MSEGDLESRMQKSVDAVNKDLTRIRTGIASPALLDSVMVEYYGQKTPVNQVANVSVPGPRTLAIKPWDKQMLSNIEKAIQISDLGVTPVNDGQLIRLNFPVLTGDRRKELAKQAKKIGEDGKIAVRNIRREENDRLKKQGKDEHESEDAVKDKLDEVQALTDKYIGIIDEMVSEKEKDILTV